MRLIFDCNVLIRALLSDTSSSARALLKAKSASETLLLSHPVLTELIEVAMRPKFDRYISKEVRQLFLEEYKSLSTNITIADHVKLCRDPKDDKYLELALSGKADCIITVDVDLLVLNPFESIPVISPDEFLHGY